MGARNVIPHNIKRIKNLAIDDSELFGWNDLRSIYLPFEWDAERFEYGTNNHKLENE